jgi:hypothetical protein
MQFMNVEDFDRLSETEKVTLIFDADKLAEKKDSEANYQLFAVDDVFIESKTSLFGKFKRVFTAFSLRDLPSDYARMLMAIPVVTADQPMQVNDNGIMSRRKESIYKRVTLSR